MNEILKWLALNLRQYGTVILPAAVILQCNGIPVGANFMVMAAGAFSYSGNINIWYLGVIVWLSLIIGDSISYWLWKKSGLLIFGRFPVMYSLLSRTMKRSEYYIDKYGPLALFFTRFPLSGFATPVNIISGISKFSFTRFLLAIFPGELLWTIFNLGVGYWFGNAWKDMGGTINQLFFWIVLVTCLIILAYMSFRHLLAKYRG